VKELKAESTGPDSTIMGSGQIVAPLTEASPIDQRAGIVRDAYD
jgi:hypothetical protein